MEYLCSLYSKPKGPKKKRKKEYTTAIVEEGAGGSNGSVHFVQCCPHRKQHLVARLILSGISGARAGSSVRDSLNL